MIPETLTRLGVLLLLVVIFSLVHWTATVLVCIVAGIKVKEAKIFFGKTLHTFSIGDVPMAIGCIPTGAFVMPDLAQEATRPRYLRAAMRWSGVVAVFGSAILALGWVKAIAAFGSALPQLVQGVISPLAFGRESINSFLVSAERSPFLGYGILAAKFAALNALPLIGKSTAHLFLERFLRKTEDEVVHMWITLSSFVMMTLLFTWGTAFVACIWKYGMH